MKHTLIVALALFVFAFANNASAQEAAEKSRGKDIAMVDTNETSMHEHGMHQHGDMKHDEHAEDTTAASEKTSVEYACPMHPEVKSDKQGKCPKCGMELVESKDKKDADTYSCPMHPEMKSDKPGKCPKCGMDLVEAKEKKEAKEEAAPSMKKKMQAMMEGKYKCCIEDACDECLKTHGECYCKDAVKNDKPVCDECYEGWKNGHGDVSGKKFEDIKKGHVHKH